MKIILSRKGFDEGNARMPSPIMPDRTPLSLPIPRGRGHCYSYDDLNFRGRSLSSIVKDLHKDLYGEPFPFKEAHADPDLDVERLPRQRGWRPAFGQTGGDQTHLKKQHVGRGDLFLFFGWFRHTHDAGDGRLLYAGPTQGFHALFGWLQVGEVYPINCQSAAEALPAWLKQHPHAAIPDAPDAFDHNNTIYVESDDLKIGGVSLSGVSGGGTFPQFTPTLRLTKLGEKRRTHWALPKWFYHENKQRRLAYHGDPQRWSADGDHAILRTVARGQEFVLNTQFYPEALDWVASLFRPAEAFAEQSAARRTVLLSFDP